MAADSSIIASAEPKVTIAGLIRPRVYRANVVSILAALSKYSWKVWLKR